MLEQKIRQVAGKLAGKLESEIAVFQRYGWIVPAHVGTPLPTSSWTGKSMASHD